MNRPNFLIFCVDQMASHCLGANGCRDARTPNLDRLAASGVTALRAYCPATVCTPSRAALMTGLTPSANGTMTNGQPLDPSLPTLPSRLANAGYRTHSVGKLHLQPYGCDAEFSAESRAGWAEGRLTCLPPDYYGFQSADYLGGHGYYVSGDYVRWLHERLENPAAWHREGRLEGWFLPDAMRNLPPELHYNQWVADRAIAFLDAAHTRTEPFLLWCSFPDPHHPFVASRPYRERFDPASLEINPTFGFKDDPLPALGRQRTAMFGSGFQEAELREALAETYAMIEHVDEQVGRVLDQVEAAGLGENTVVVFLSDHGDYLGSHGLIKKSLWQYEELQRIPFLLRLPGAPSARWSTPVSLLDLLPTALDLAGIPVEGEALAGRSLAPSLRAGSEPPPVPVLIEHQQDQKEGGAIRVRTIHDGTRKLVHYGHFGSLAYDLATDPHEEHNRADDAAFCAPLADRLIGEMLRTTRVRPRLASD